MVGLKIRHDAIRRRFRAVQHFCCFSLSQKINMEDWIFVENEDDVLRQCWQNLPIQIDFEEFKQRMHELRKQTETLQNHSRLQRWSYTSVWVIQKLYGMTGYASSLYTVIKYRSYLFWLVAWTLQLL